MRVVKAKLRVVMEFEGGEVEIEGVEGKIEGVTLPSSASVFFKTFIASHRGDVQTSAIAHSIGKYLPFCMHLRLLV